MQKGVFFHEHKRKDGIKYKMIFLCKIKSLLSYFIEFSDNRSILSKVYLNDCIVKGSDRRPIIIIICDKSKFSANDSC